MGEDNYRHGVAEPQRRHPDYHSSSFGSDPGKTFGEAPERPGGTGGGGPHVSEIKHVHRGDPNQKNHQAHQSSHHIPHPHQQIHSQHHQQMEHGPRLAAPPSHPQMTVPVPDYSMYGMYMPPTAYGQHPYGMPSAPPPPANSQYIQSIAPPIDGGFVPHQEHINYMPQPSHDYNQSSHRPQPNHRHSTIPHPHPYADAAASTKRRARPQPQSQQQFQHQPQHPQQYPPQHQQQQDHPYSYNQTTGQHVDQSVQHGQMYQNQHHEAMYQQNGHHNGFSDPNQEVEFDAMTGAPIARQAPGPAAGSNLNTPGMSDRSTAASALISAIVPVDNGKGSKVYKCPRPLCTKVYKNPNGLKYHLDRGACEVDHDVMEATTGISLHTDDPTALFNLQQQAQQALGSGYDSFNSGNSGNSGSNGMQKITGPSVAGNGGQGGAPNAANLTAALMASDESLKIVHRPYGCKISGCGKRYQNLNGLKYHAKTAHVGMDFKNDVYVLYPF
ncbi:hypothetical protein HDU78_001488 [Chytriomyces hyalinus]|nr:hypothetical protein HDU78_001488 [Chytriomyces hyalinus]